jgi:hypothetical protein
MDLYMNEKIEAELRTCLGKIDELRMDLKRLESDNPKDKYNITVTRDRLAYWEGKSDGLRFALEHGSEK